MDIKIKQKLLLCSDKVTQGSLKKNKILQKKYTHKHSLDEMNSVTNILEVVPNEIKKYIKSLKEKNFDIALAKSFISQIYFHQDIDDF